MTSLLDRLRRWLGLYELADAIGSVQRQVEIQQDQIDALEARMREFDVEGGKVLDQ